MKLSNFRGRSATSDPRRRDHAFATRSRASLDLLFVDIANLGIGEEGFWFEDDAGKRYVWECTLSIPERQAVIAEFKPHWQAVRQGLGDTASDNRDARAKLGAMHPSRPE